MPLATAPAYVARARTSPLRRREGAMVLLQSQSIEIVHIVLVVLSENARAFLQVGRRVHGLPRCGLPSRVYGPRQLNSFFIFLENRNRFYF